MRQLSLLGLTLLAACASNSVFESWRGHHVDDLVFAWGPPAKYLTMRDGRHMVEYVHSRTVQGTAYDCAVTFFADAEGTIVRTSVDGNIGGCNTFLRSKRPAS